MLPACEPWKLLRTVMIEPKMLTQSVKALGGQRQQVRHDKGVDGGFFRLSTVYSLLFKRGSACWRVRCRTGDASFRPWPVRVLRGA